ncbi:histone deacetylase [Kitasatospora sp. NPDC092948]|uniref:histone deacetylase n=1 Tax=Kitasatospora sp. NPDC092948 TaxID=3364088 RepID=UPI0037F7DD6D
MNESRPPRAQPLPSARRPSPLPGLPAAPTSVWYAAYGSNMHAGRLAHYIAGGRPAGAAQTCPGCRDRTLPERTLPVMLPGTLYFALESPTWTGGSAFYDPTGTGDVPARAYLLTVEQFADILAQEMRRKPGTGADLDLTHVLATGRERFGPGRYETVLCPGGLDDIPVLTFTAPWTLAEAALNPPSATYLANLAAGLGEAHGWTPGQAAAYLATRPGATARWTPDSVLRAIRPASRPSI